MIGGCERLAARIVWVCNMTTFFLVIKCYDFGQDDLGIEALGFVSHRE